jgi:hemerythrin-like domain-containing protein
MVHDQGRAFVLGMETAVQKTFDTGQESTLAQNALAYAALLREYIAKEDDILYPLAEWVLPEAMRGNIVEGYRRAEERTGSELSEQYHKLVERYEQE